MIREELMMFPDLEKFVDVTLVIKFTNQTKPAQARFAPVFQDARQVLKSQNYEEHTDAVSTAN